MSNGASDPIITWRHKPDALPLLRAFGYFPVVLPHQWVMLLPREVHKCGLISGAASHQEDL